MRYLIVALGVTSLVLSATQTAAQRSPAPPTPRAAPAVGWIGITYSPLQGSDASNEQAVIVNAVHAGSPAHAAGIRPGDTIVGVDGRPDVLQQMRTLRPRPGDAIRFRVRRGGERDRDVTIVAGEGQPGFAGVFEPRGVLELQGSRTPWPAVFSSGWLGISHPFAAPFWSSQQTESFPVTAVYPDSPAARAGIQPGDTIVRVDGDTDAVQRMSALRLQPGDTVRLRVRRPGQRDRDVALIAAERPGAVTIRGMAAGPRTGVTEVRQGPDGERIMIVNGDTIRFPVERIVRQMDTLQQRLRTFYADSLARHVVRFEREHLPDLQRRLQSLDSVMVNRFPSAIVFETGRRGIAGAEFSDLNPDLANFFEGAGEGVLVLRVAPESPAARAGLRAGDVVTEVNGVSVRSTHELRNVVAQARGEDVAMRVVRRGRPIQLTLP